MIFDSISEADQCTGQLVVIDVLDILLRAEHFVILKCFPPAFGGIVSRVEKDAMAVQMRVEGARGIVMKDCAHYISGFPIGQTSGAAHAG
ncbi:MAG: hypothetical protein ABIP85_20230 [Chthoniobacteraceae bacterium]